MAKANWQPVLQQIRGLFAEVPSDELSDGRLLERFIRLNDESAFETLLRRHGAMVQDVCRSVLHDHHDADDAFQATFLILARKASTIRKRDSVGGSRKAVASASMSCNSCGSAAW